MKKKIAIVMVSIIIMMQFCCLFAETKAKEFTGEKDGVTWTYNNITGVLTFSGTGEVTEEWKNEIPTYSKSVNKVIIEEGITEIGTSAFSDCYRLNEVTLPNSLTKINDFAFNSTNLTELTIPSNVQQINSGLILGCENFTQFKLDNNNNFLIQDGVLYNSAKTELIAYPAQKIEETFNVPESVQKVYSYSFSGCRNLKTINIPESVTVLYSYGLDGCYGLENINVNENNNNYSSVDGVLFNKSKSTLIYCPSNREGSYIVPNTVNMIGEYGFSFSKLTSIEIPNSVTSIGRRAFNSCGNLTNINLPNGITNIENHTFCNSTSLANIILPNSVTTIGDYAFSNCTSITNINLTDSIISIGPCAFMNCSNLEEIIIPSSMSSIFAGTFKGCGKLTHVTIPEGITFIGEQAFNNCTLLTEISLPSTLQTIGDWAFGYCFELTESGIEIPSGVQEIGAGILYWNRKMEKIRIQADNENFVVDEQGVLYDKNKTRLISYPAGNTEETFTIPNTIEKVDFAGATNLKTLIIPNSVNQIITSYGSLNIDSLENFEVSQDNINYSNNEDGILFNKDKTILICYPKAKIDEVYEIPNTVSKIDEYAFNNSDNLERVVIPNSVKVIATETFYGCNNLEKVVLPPTVEDIGPDVFGSCPNITVYCKSNTVASKYVSDYEVNHIIDDEEPTISSITQNGTSITIQAADEKVGLAKYAYSIDGETWFENNVFSINETGEYTIRVRDELGNIKTQTITVDLEAPVINSINIENNTITVTATDEGSGLANKPYSIDGQNWQSSNAISVSQSGTYTVYVKDAANNIAESESFVVDTTPPTITKIETNGNKIVVTATDDYIGLADKPYSLDGENWQSSNIIEVEEDGEYSVFVKDRNGNISKRENVVIDTSSPGEDPGEDPGEAPGEDPTEDTKKPTIESVEVEKNKIIIKAQDENGKLAEKPYSIDGENWQSSNIFTLMKSGKYKIYVKDAAGNIAIQEEVLVDMDSPIIVSATVSNLTIEVVAKDEHSSLATKAYSIDGKNWQESSTLEVEKSGQYTVYVKDVFGNISTTIVKVGGQSEKEEKPSNNENNGGSSSSSNTNNKGASESKSSKTEIDNTQANKSISQLGAKSIIIFLVISIIIARISYVKFKKNR